MNDAIGETISTSSRQPAHSRSNESGGNNTNKSEKRASTLKGADLDGSIVAEHSAAGAKQKRQARQAAIIIEELERALGESSSKGPESRRRDPRRNKAGNLEAGNLEGGDESDVAPYSGGDLSD